MDSTFIRQFLCCFFTAINLLEFKKAKKKWCESKRQLWVFPKKSSFKVFEKNLDNLLRHWESRQHRLLIVNSLISSVHILTSNLFSPLIDRVYNITSLVKVAMKNELNGSEKKEHKGEFQSPDRQKKTEIMTFWMSSIEMLDLLHNDIHYLPVMQQNVGRTFLSTQWIQFKVPTTFFWKKKTKILTQKKPWKLLNAA